MRLAGALLVVVVLASSALAKPVTFEVPPGFVEAPGGADEILAHFRAQPSTVSASGVVWQREDGNVTLMQVTWLSKAERGIWTRAAVEALDRGVDRGATEKATTIHAKDARQVVNNQLVAETLFEREGALFHQLRIWGLDRENVLHMAMFICAGPEDELGACRRAQNTMTVEANEPFRDAVDTGARGDKGESIAYMVGQVIGTLLIVLLIAAPIYLYERKKK